MRGNVACAAFLAIKFDRSCEDTEDKCVPQEEERVKLSDRCPSHDRNPREDKRECGENPHTLPEPAFNKVFAHHLMHHNNCLPRAMAMSLSHLGSIAYMHPL